MHLTDFEMSFPNTEGLLSQKLRIRTCFHEGATCGTCRWTGNTAEGQGAGRTLRRSAERCVVCIRNAWEAPVHVLHVLCPVWLL